MTQHEIEWNIHEIVEPLQHDEMMEVLCYITDDNTKLIPIKFYGCSYVIYPGLWWGNIEENDIIRLCLTFPNERKSRNAVLPSLRSGMTMLDVGACYGSWTLPAASMGMDVIAIEPDSYSSSILQEHIKKNGFQSRVKVIKQFVGSDLTNSIDYLVQLHELKRVDFIKIDVEGSEFDVLAGAKKTIRKFKPKLLVELHTMKHRKTPDDEIKYLTKLCPKLKYQHFTMSQQDRKEDTEYFHMYHYI